jgi:hypothetical protein
MNEELVKFSLKQLHHRLDLFRQNVCESQRLRLYR